MHGVGIAQPAKDQRERRQPKIGFRLAAAGGEEQEVDDLALDMGGFGDAAQVHQICRRAGRDAMQAPLSPRARCRLPCALRRRAAAAMARLAMRNASSRSGIFEQVDAGLDTGRRTA